MSIQVKIRTALAALSKHGQNVTAACNVVVQMQRNSSLLSKLGAVTAGATLLGNVLKLPSPSKLLGLLAKYELPGVDVIGLLMRDHRPLPVGFAWDDGWKCAEFNGTCVYGNTNGRSFVYVDGDVANVEVSLRTSSGGPNQTAMLAALATQRQAAKQACTLLERFLWAALGDAAAAEHVARAVGTSTRSVDAAPPT